MKLTLHEFSFIKATAPHFTVTATASFDPYLFLHHKIYPYSTHPLQATFLHLSFKDRFSSLQAQMQQQAQRRTAQGQQEE